MLWADLLLQLASIADDEGTEFSASRHPLYTKADISEIEELTGEKYLWQKISGDEVSESSWIATPSVSTGGNAYFFNMSRENYAVSMGPLTQYDPGVLMSGEASELVEYLSKRGKELQELEVMAKELQYKIERLKEFKL